MSSCHVFTKINLQLTKDFDQIIHSKFELTSTLDMLFMDAPKQSVAVIIQLFAYLCHLLITFANSLDPDQARQNVGTDLSRTSKRHSYRFQGLKTYEKYGFT